MTEGISEFSNSETTYVYHYGIIKETPDARLFNTDFGHIWIPKNPKITLSMDKEIVAVATWFAEKKEISTKKGGF